MMPNSIGAVARIAAASLLLGLILGAGGFWYFGAQSSEIETSNAERAPATIPFDAGQPYQEPAAPVDVELTRLLAEAPGALLPAAYHQLEARERIELSTISTIQSRELGVQLDIPFGLDARHRSHTVVRYEFANPDGHTLNATLVRWARCRPRFDQLYNLRSRIGHVSDELRNPANHRLASYLIALRLVGLEEVRGRLPHYTYDIVQVGNGTGYLRSTSGPCAQCQTTAREFLLEWTEEVDGGYKDMTLAITSNYPGVDPDLLVQMARTIRMDDSTILQCERPSWPNEPDAIIRRIDELNLMDPGTETYRDEAGRIDNPADAGSTADPAPDDPAAIREE